LKTLYTIIYRYIHIIEIYFARFFLSCYIVFIITFNLIYDFINNKNIEIGEFFMEDTNSSIYALKTSVGQERSVARLLARKAKMPGVGISSILVPESLKGYILVESDTKIDLRNPNLKVQHLRGVVEGKGGITFEEAKRFLKPEPIISSIQKGSIVELISGPFKGERAKVVRIDESREEVVLELIEAAVPIPVTVKADQIRIIQKEAD
jgi:transcriptional antiterminator NusG